jgi:hypothetical protein
MSDLPFMNLDEETINYERILHAALNPSDGSTEGRAGSAPLNLTLSGSLDRDGGAPATAGIKPCPSEPFDLERFLEFVFNDMTILVKRMNSIQTSHEFIGRKDAVASIKLCVELLESGFKERWPERSKIILEAENIVDLRSYQRRVPDEVA